MQFIGNIEAKLDAKGRVFLPAFFRKCFDGGISRVVMRKDIYENCLVLYPEETWNSQLVDLRSHLSRWNERHQKLYRQFVSEAESLVLDANGRLLIPKRYLKMCAINQEVRFIGMGDTIEVWAKECIGEAFADAEELGCELDKIIKLRY